MIKTDKRKDQQKLASANYRAKKKMRIEKLIAAIEELIKEWKNK